MAVSEIDKHRRRWEENPKGLTFAPYADALRKAGEAEQALDVLRAGLEHHPDYIPANIVLGRCYLDIGDDPGAETAFERVLHLDPENVIALKALADVSERGRRWPTATRWLDALLAIDRGNESAREQLARVQLAEVDDAADNGTMPAYGAAPFDQRSSDPIETIVEPTAIAGASDASSYAAPPMGLERNGPDPMLEASIDASDADEMAIEMEPRNEIDFAPIAPAVVAPDEAYVVEAVTDSTETDDGFVIEESPEPIFGAAPISAAGEFAVHDASSSLGGGSDDAVADTPEPSWADVGSGEFVPSIFAADDRSDAPSDTSDVPLEPMGGLELEAPAESLVFASMLADEEAAEADLTADAALATEPLAEHTSEMHGGPIVVPSPVHVLALDDEQLASLDRAARDSAIASLLQRRDRAPIDVLAMAPQADPAVVASLAAAAVPVAAPVSFEASLVAAMLHDDASLAPWDAWNWGELDPDLSTLQREPDAAAAAAEPSVAVTADHAAAEEPVGEPIPAPFAAAEPVVEPEPVADELPDDQAAAPPDFAAPVLVTAAMAALYEGQGHTREALATYRELELRAPGAHTERIALLESKLATVALPAPPVYAARLSGGQPVRDFFGSVLRTMPPALAMAVPSRAEDGVALRRAEEPVSLGRLFGEEPTATVRAPGIAARTASFDEFYGAAAPAADAGGRDDLEQFHAWLQGLKT